MDQSNNLVIRALNWVKPWIRQDNYENQYPRTYDFENVQKWRNSKQKEKEECSKWVVSFEVYTANKLCAMYKNEQPQPAI